MREKTFKTDEWLWKKGTEALGCYFIYSGNFQLVEKPAKNAKNIPEFTCKGNLVGDFPGLTGDGICTTSIKCTEDAEVYFIAKEP